MTLSTDSINQLLAAAGSIAARTKEASQLDEGRLMEIFAQSGLLSSIGYGSLDADCRCTGHVSPDQAALTLCSFTGSPIALVEFIRPGVDLAKQILRLENHARQVLSRMPSIAALTNGSELWLYQARDGHLQRPPQEFMLADLSTEQARILHGVFQHRQVDWSRQQRHAPHTLKGAPPASIPFTLSRKDSSSRK